MRLMSCTIVAWSLVVAVAAALSGGQGAVGVMGGIFNGGG